MGTSRSEGRTRETRRASLSYRVPRNGFDDIGRTYFPSLHPSSAKSLRARSSRSPCVRHARDPRRRSRGAAVTTPDAGARGSGTCRLRRRPLRFGPWSSTSRARLLLAIGTELGSPIGLTTRRESSSTESATTCMVDIKPINILLMTFDLRAALHGAMLNGGSSETSSSMISGKRCSARRA